jgi:hypothetical protein
VQDVYTFSAAAGQRVYFLVPNSFSYIEQLVFIGWTLTDAGGNRVFADDFGGGDPGAYTLTRGGTYTLTVDDREFFTTGPYAFQTLNVPPPSTFAIHVGDTVQPDQPGPGAGRIETPGAKDIYTFTGTAGMKLSFAMTNVDPPVSFARWALADDQGNVLFDTCLGCSDPDPVTLSHDGVYTVTVGSDRDPWAGTYQFTIQLTP